MVIVSSLSRYVVWTEEKAVYSVEKVVDEDAIADIAYLQQYCTVSRHYHYWSLCSDLQVCSQVNIELRSVRTYKITGFYGSTFLNLCDFDKYLIYFREWKLNGYLTIKVSQTYSIIMFSAER